MIDKRHWLEYDNYKSMIRVCSAQKNQDVEVHILTYPKYSKPVLPDTQPNSVTLYRYLNFKDAGSGN